jgi:hypothetical protein
MESVLRQNESKVRSAQFVNLIGDPTRIVSIVSPVIGNQCLHSLVTVVFDDVLGHGRTSRKALIKPYRIGVRSITERKAKSYYN